MIQVCMIVYTHMKMVLIRSELTNGHGWIRNIGYSPIIWPYHTVFLYDDHNHAVRNGGIKYLVSNEFSLVSWVDLVMYVMGIVRSCVGTASIQDAHCVIVC